jgi:hypothetical protein
MSSEHSELPWKQVNELDIVDASGFHLARSGWWYGDAATNALIVLSVNNHQRLVQKLQAIIDNADDFYSTEFADALEGGADILTEIEGDE